jgi:hypothetical protein
MNMFKFGERDTPLQLLEKAERCVDNLKKLWYFHHKDLGDMLGNQSAVKAMTTTYNNLGVFHKRY